MLGLYSQARVVLTFTSSITRAHAKGCANNVPFLGSDNMRLLVPTLVVVLAQAMLIQAGRADNASLTTPERAVAAHYAALKSGDAAALREVHGDISWYSREAESKRIANLHGYKVLCVRPYETASGPAQPGDVHLLVLETYKSSDSANSFSLMNFILRESSRRWRIVDMNAYDPAEWTSVEEIEKQRKK